MYIFSQTTHIIVYSNFRVKNKWKTREREWEQILSWVTGVVHARTWSGVDWFDILLAHSDCSMWSRIPLPPPKGARSVAITVYPAVPLSVWPPPPPQYYMIRVHNCPHRQSDYYVKIRNVFKNVSIYYNNVRNIIPI